MKKWVMTLMLVAFFLPSVSISATLDPPWKPIEKTSDWEYWYKGDK